MFPLEIHLRADRLCPSANDPLLIFLGSFEQENVQFLPAADLRHGHQMVPAKVSAFSFHAALLVTFSRCAELGLETDRKSTRLNSSHLVISYAVFCLKKKKKDP